MPYIDGHRVSNEEWMRRYGTITKLRTGANGENPAEAPAIDEVTGTVVAEPKQTAGGNRSAHSAAATRAAIADALGVTADSDALDDIDVTGLDAPSTTEEDA